MKDRHTLSPIGRAQIEPTAQKRSNSTHNEHLRTRMPSQAKYHHSFNALLLLLLLLLLLICSALLCSALRFAAPDQQLLLLFLLLLSSSSFVSFSSCQQRLHLHL